MSSILPGGYDIELLVPVSASLRRAMATASFNNPPLARSGEPLQAVRFAQKGLDGMD